MATLLVFHAEKVASSEQFGIFLQTLFGKKCWCTKGKPSSCNETNYMASMNIAVKDGSAGLQKIFIHK